MGHICFDGVVVIIGFVVLFVVLCSRGSDVWWRFLPSIARVEVVNPVLDPAGYAGDYVPHRDMILPQRVACWSRVEKISVEIPSKAPLLNWLQRHGLALLDFKDGPFPTLQPRVMLCCRMRPKASHCHEAIAA